MKQVIGKNQYFEIYVDTAKNRLYITVSGFWSTIDILEDYASQQTKALKQIKQGFTVMADVRTLKTLPADLVSRHQQTQDELLKYGVRHVAEIMPKSAISNMQLTVTTKGNNMPRRQFATPEEAENWLNSLAINI